MWSPASFSIRLAYFRLNVCCITPHHQSCSKLLCSWLASPPRLTPHLPSFTRVLPLCYTPSHTTTLHFGSANECQVHAQPQELFNALQDTGLVTIDTHSPSEPRTRSALLPINRLRWVRRQIYTHKFIPGESLDSDSQGLNLHDSLRWSRDSYESTPVFRHRQDPPPPIPSRRWSCVGAIIHTIYDNTSTHNTYHARGRGNVWYCTLVLLSLLCMYRRCTLYCDDYPRR